MKKIVIDPDNIDAALVKEAAETLLSGGIVALPTETVYGLAAVFNKKDAVKRLYEIKKREADKPFTVVVGDVEEAKYQYLAPLSPFGYRLIEKFWPGPLTIIYYNKQEKTIGVRVPAHRVTQQILKEVNTAVCLPSANISGEKESVSAASVESALGDKVDLIVDSGECAYSQSSTIVDLTFHPFEILRKGVVSQQQIIEVFTKKRILFVCTGNTCRSPLAQILLEKNILETMPYLNERYEIISRGISAAEGSALSKEVEWILAQKEDVHMKEFTAKKLDRPVILSSDLIFTMEVEQQKYILNLEPTAEGRVFPLGKFADSAQGRDITDPIGEGMEVYEQTYAVIKEAVLELGDWL